MTALSIYIALWLLSYTIIEVYHYIFEEQSFLSFIPIAIRTRPVIETVLVLFTMPLLWLALIPYHKQKET